MLAAGAIRAGQYDTVLVFGMEKMPKGIIRSSFFEPWREEGGLAVTPAYFALRGKGSHAAVLAAKLEASLADRFGLAVWPGGAGYFTGPQPIQSPLLASYRVLQSLPFDRRKVREWLRALS